MFGIKNRGSTTRSNRKLTPIPKSKITPKNRKKKVVEEVTQDSIMATQQLIIMPHPSYSAAIFTIRHRFANAVDLNISVLDNGYVKISNGTNILLIEGREFSVVVDAAINGCSTSSDNNTLSCVIYYKSGSKSMTINQGKSFVKFPFIQESISKLTQVIFTIIHFRSHCEKDIIRKDLENVVIRCLFMFRLRLNAIHDQMCPGCQDGGQSRHYCGTEVVSHKIVPAIQVRACEDVVMYDACMSQHLPGTISQTIELKLQVEKLYSIFNVCPQSTINYDVVSSGELKEKVLDICILRNESNTCELLDFNHIRVIYDRLFYRDVELISLTTFPSRNSMCDFGN